MSKRSFVDFRGHGFWIYDVAKGIFLKYLIDAAEASGQADNPWLSNAVSSWRTQACISDFGITLAGDWSAEQRQAFISLVEVANANLAARESIPAEEIEGWRVHEDLRIGTRNESEMRTAPIVEVGQAIIALVRGQLPDAPEGETWIYGTPTGRQTRRRMK